MPNEVRLGKKAPKLDPRTLKLADYLAPIVPPPLAAPPDEVSWVVKVPGWGMMLNDSLGDCVIACAGHVIEQLTFFAGKPFTPADDAILKGYEDVGGYIPGNPSTDQGCFILDALKYWRNTGIANHKILAFVSVDPANLVEVRQAIELFGNVVIGLALPQSAQGQTAWTVQDGGPFNSGSPGSWGGHCVPVMAASPQSLTCVTWGARLKMSHNFFRDYCDEAYVVVSSDFIEANGLSPSQFNLAQLEADLKQL